MIFLETAPLAPLGGVFKGAFSGAGAQIKSVMSKFLWGLGILLILGVIGYFIYKDRKSVV